MHKAGATVIRRNPDLTIAAVLQVLLSKKDIHLDVIFFSCLKVNIFKLRPELCYFCIPDKHEPLPMNTVLANIQNDTLQLLERAG